MVSYLVTRIITFLRVSQAAAIVLVHSLRLLHTALVLGLTPVLFHIRYSN